MHIWIWYLKRPKYVSWHEVFTYDMWRLTFNFLNSSHGVLKTPKYLPHFSIFILWIFCALNCSWAWSWLLPTKSNKFLPVVNESSLIKTLSVIYIMIMFEWLFSHQSSIQVVVTYSTSHTTGTYLWETYITSTSEKELLAANIWAQGNSSDARVF